MKDHIKRTKLEIKNMNNIILSYSYGHITEEALSQLMKAHTRRIIELRNHKDHKYYYDQILNKFVYGIPKKS